LVVQQGEAASTILEGRCNDDQGLVSHVGLGGRNCVGQELQRVDVRKVRRLDPHAQVSMSGKPDR
jgi:hypothetical protein